MWPGPWLVVSKDAFMTQMYILIDKCSEERGKIHYMQRDEKKIKLTRFRPESSKRLVEQHLQAHLEKRHARDNSQGQRSWLDQRFLEFPVHKVK